MQLQKFLQEFSEANANQDHFKMLEAMQKFFSAIHNANEKDGVLLGLYSMAQQLESMGLNGQVIKNAVHSRIASRYAQYPATWKEVTVGLNTLLRTDNRGYEQITIKD